MKNQATLRAGENWFGTEMVRSYQPQVVNVWKHRCVKCGNQTTIFVMNPKEPVRAFCCGKWVTPETEKKPEQQRENALPSTLIGER